MCCFLVAGLKLKLSTVNVQVLMCTVHVSLLKILLDWSLSHSEVPLPASFSNACYLSRLLYKHLIYIEIIFTRKL